MIAELMLNVFTILQNLKEISKINERKFTASPVI